MAIPKDGSAEWLEWRKAGIGGSDLATIASRPLNYFAHGSEWEVYLSKKGDLQVEDNFRMKYGRAVEALIGRMWAESRGLRFDFVDVDQFEAGGASWGAADFRDFAGCVLWKPPVVVDPANPHRRGTPDGLVIDYPADEGGTPPVDVVEVKTTGIENAWEWAKEPPPRVQVQGFYYAHLLVLNGVDVRNVVFLCEINHNPPIEFVLPYDPQFGAALAKIADDWWSKYIVGDATPDLDGSKAADGYIDAKATRKPDDEVQGDEELFREYYTTKKAKDAAEHAHNVAKQKAKLALDGADVISGTLDGVDVKLTNRADKNGKRAMKSFPTRLD